MTATSPDLRYRRSPVPACLTNHPLNIPETAVALRVGARAIVQSLGALGLDVRRDVRSPASPDLPLNHSHSVSEAITDQPVRAPALLENRHAHFRASQDIAGNRVKVRHV